MHLYNEYYFRWKVTTFPTPMGLGSQGTAKDLLVGKTDSISRRSSLTGWWVLLDRWLPLDCCKDLFRWLFVLQSHWQIHFMLLPRSIQFPVFNAQSMIHLSILVGKIRKECSVRRLFNVNGQDTGNSRASHSDSCSCQC